MIHFMKGMPYIYQGEEIGMTNVRFDSIDDYKDIKSLNAYNEHVGINLSHDEMMAGIHKDGRDNARTPMQWDDTEHAGFTTGSPWIKVNPNYKSINVKNALANHNSIFYHYQKLIQLRKDMDVIVYSDFKQFCCENKNLFVYTRFDAKQKLLVVMNHTDEIQSFEIPEELNKDQWQLLISNYQDSSLDPTMLSLRPYESIVYHT